MKPLKPPGLEFTLYGVYHHHEYGGHIHLVWADHDPSEQEVVAACGMEFEPDRDEWIAINSINEAATIPIATAQHGVDSKAGHMLVRPADVGSKISRKVAR